MLPSQQRLLRGRIAEERVAAENRRFKTWLLQCWWIQFHRFLTILATPMKRLRATFSIVFPFSETSHQMHNETPNGRKTHHPRGESNKIIQNPSLPAPLCHVFPSWSNSVHLNFESETRNAANRFIPNVTLQTT